MRMSGREDVGRVEGGLSVIWVRLVLDCFVLDDYLYLTACTW